MDKGDLIVSICGLSIMIEFDNQKIIAEIPDYRTMRELEKNIDVVLKEYGLKQINDASKVIKRRIPNGGKSEESRSDS